MHWELWDRESANLIEEFNSEEEGLQGVREMLAVNNPDLVDELSLGAMYDEGEPHEVELPPSLYGEALKARLGEMAREEVAEASHKIHKRIRTWLDEEGWHVNNVPIPPDSFNIVATHQDGRAINIIQAKMEQDSIAISLKWSRDRVQQLIGTLTDAEVNGLMWNIYRDVSLMGVDIYEPVEPAISMILRTHLYFDGMTKDSLMQRVQLVNRAYALAMRTSLRVLEAPDRVETHTFSPEDLRRIVRPLAQVDDPLALAS
jgi:hypothetical protein